MLPPPPERELPELKPPPELPMLLPEREVVDIVERYELDAFCEKLDELLLPDDTFDEPVEVLLRLDDVP